MGMSVRGAYIYTSAPSFLRPKRLDFATRLCFMSPRMATLRPSIFPNFSRMVNMSKSA